MTENPIKTCAVKGCRRKVDILKHKLCKAHVQRLYKWGNPLPEKKIAKRTIHNPYHIVNLRNPKD